MNRAAKYWSQSCVIEALSAGQVGKTILIGGSQPRVDDLLSKWKFWGSDPIFTLILFGMFIPYQAILIPLIQFLNRPGMYGSW